jgi:signal transduction histidine kinase
MSRLSAPARRHGLDLLIGLAALDAALRVALAGESARAPTTTAWVTVPAVAALVLILIERRRFPFAAPAAVWLLAAALSFLDGRLVVFAASVFAVGMVAAALLGHLRDERQSRLGLAIVLGGAAIVVYNDPSHTGGALVFTPVLFGIAWIAGLALRERAAQAEAAELRAATAERERDAASRVAVAEERARIARELHDIVAHAVSVMVLQVGAVRHRLPDADGQDREALEAVEQAGRTALGEMRRLLGAMRRDGDAVELAPQPGLDAVEQLLEEVRRAGLPVRLHVEGEPSSLPRAIDLSAYRIVQEGLTNALRHANAAHVEVTLRYEPAQLRIEVRDDGRGIAAADGLGHGLVGIRERVKIYGGEMSAGNANGRGFVLSARLPLAGHLP